MSAANKDEAIKCLGLAQKYCDNSNYSLARKYANKSISLFSTPEASELLNSINQREAATANGEPQSNDASLPTEESTAGTRHQHTSHANTSASGSTEDKDEEKAPEYTPEQAVVVAQIRKCRATEYYEILSLKKECSEDDIKKAYRKLALQLHPDKNGAPGADEAFKMVSKAFQVLSDANLRAAFDSHGGDPESRAFRRASFRSGSGGGGMTFVSPEELFKGFFGGGFPGVHVFGANGFQCANFGGARVPRQQAADDQRPPFHFKLNLSSTAPPTTHTMSSQPPTFPMTSNPIHGHKSRAFSFSSPLKKDITTSASGSAPTSFAGPPTTNMPASNAKLKPTFSFPTSGSMNGTSFAQSEIRASQDEVDYWKGLRGLNISFLANAQRLFEEEEFADLSELFTGYHKIRNELNEKRRVV